MSLTYNYLEIIWKEYIPAGIIISMVNILLNNDFTLKYFLSSEFIYRFLLSIIFISMLGAIIGVLLNHYNKKNKLKKWVYIIIKGILGFGLPIGVIKYIFDYTPGEYIPDDLLIHIIIILSLGVVYGFIKWYHPEHKE